MPPALCPTTRPVLSTNAKVGVELTPLMPNRRLKPFKPPEYSAEFLPVNVELPPIASCQDLNCPPATMTKILQAPDPLNLACSDEEEFTDCA